MPGHYRSMELGRSLATVTYPCGKDELLQIARMNGIDDELLIQLELLPDRVYEGVHEALLLADDRAHSLSGDFLN